MGATGAGPIRRPSRRRCRGGRGRWCSRPGPRSSRCRTRSGCRPRGGGPARMHPGQPQGRTWGAHVPAVGEERHRTRPPADRDLQDHGGGSEPITLRVRVSATGEPLLAMGLWQRGCAWRPRTGSCRRFYRAPRRRRRGSPGQGQHEGSLLPQEDVRVVSRLDFKMDRVGALLPGLRRLDGGQHGPHAGRRDLDFVRASGRSRRDR